MLKKIISYILIIVMLFSSVLISYPPIEAWAAPTLYSHFSSDKYYSKARLPHIGRGDKSGVNLLKVHTPDGIKRVFCMKPSGVAHFKHGSNKVSVKKDDEYTMQKTLCRNLSNSTSNPKQGANLKKIAKALIWLNDLDGDYYSSYPHEQNNLEANCLVQMYVWSRSIKKNPETTLNQFISSSGISDGKAKKMRKWLEQINDVKRVYGAVEIYTIYNCYWEGSTKELSMHQMYIRWVPVEPKSDKLRESYSENRVLQGQLVLDKKIGLESQKPVQNAAFRITSSDGAVVSATNFYTDINGRATVNWSRDIGTVTKTSRYYPYYSNWDDLSEKVQNRAAKNGIYSRSAASAKAMEEAIEEVNKAFSKAEQIIHYWNIEEINGGPKHVRSTPNSWRLVESPYMFFDAVNPGKKGRITVIKEKDPNNANYKAGADFAGAKFNIVANERLHRIDKKGYWEKGSVVTSVIIGRNNQATTDYIPAGEYKIVEVNAPGNGLFEINNGNHIVNLVSDNDSVDIGIKTIKITEPPKEWYGTLTKYYEVSDTEDRIEPGVRFRLKGRQKLESGSHPNITVDSDGYYSVVKTTDSSGQLTFDHVPYGDYVLHQESKTSMTKRVPDMQFTVNEKTPHDIASIAGAYTKKINGKYVFYNESNARICIHKDKVASTYTAYKNNKWEAISRASESNVKFAIYSDDVYNQYINTTGYTDLRDEAFAMNNALDIITTDSKGNATSKILPCDYYYVVQLNKVSKDYAYADDLLADLHDPDDETDHSYVIENPSMIHALEIQKDTIERNEKGLPVQGTDAPERDAEFYVLNLSMIPEEDLNVYEEDFYLDRLVEEDRVNFVQNHSDAIIGKMTTDPSGKASMNFPKTFDFSDEYIVIQTKGTKGYDIQKPIKSTDTNSVIKKRSRMHADGQTDYYFIDIDNPKEYKYGIITANKVKKVNGQGETEIEPGAKFWLIDEEGTRFSYKHPSTGETVNEFVTDENGVLHIPYIRPGTYFLIQQDGSKLHEFIDPYKGDNVILMTEEKMAYSHNAMDYIVEHNFDTSRATEEQKAAIEKSTYTYLNEEKPVKLRIRKSSSITDMPLDYANFTVYKKGNEEEGEEDTLIGTYDTGDTDNNFESGMIEINNLKMGTYIIEETYPPDGYASFKNYPAFSEEKANGQPIKKRVEVTIDLAHMHYQEQGGYVYYEANPEDNFGPDVVPHDGVLDFKETPVMGRVAINKKGEVTTQFDSQGSFEYDTQNIGDSVYGIYAAEDIKNEKGITIYQKDELIAVTKTNKEAPVYFARKVKGIEENIPSQETEIPKWNSSTKELTTETVPATDRFYQGNYYIKELLAPNGYSFDNIQYITITGDLGALNSKDVFRLDDDEPIEEGDMIRANYFLTTGKSFNDLVKKTGKKPTKIIFTHKTAPSGKTFSNGQLVDVSAAKNQLIAMWWIDNDNGADFYVSTQKNNQSIIFNRDCSYMFYQMANLRGFYFDNINTDYVEDMTSMFETFSVFLKDLDLMNFTTPELEISNRMFAKDVSLQKIYMGDNEQIPKPFEVMPEDLNARAKRKFWYGNDMESKKFLPEDFSYGLVYSDFAESIDIEDIITKIEGPTNTEYPVFTDPNQKEGTMQVIIRYDQSQLADCITEEMVTNFNAKTEDARAVSGRAPWTSQSMADAINAVTNGIISTEIEVINPNWKKIFANSYDEDPLQMVESQEPNKKLKITIFKTSTTDTAHTNWDEKIDIGGAKIKITAMTDLKNKKGQIILNEGDEVDTLISASVKESEAGLPSVELPADLEPVDPDVKVLYKIEEISAPPGFEINDGVLYVPNFKYDDENMTNEQLNSLIHNNSVNPDLFNPSFENTLELQGKMEKILVSDPNDPNNTEKVEQTTVYQFMAIFADKPVIEIIKHWIDTPDKSRPQLPNELIIEARRKSDDTVVKQFHLNQNNDWRVQWKDIPGNSSLNDYNFTEIIPDDVRWRQSGTPVTFSTDPVTQIVNVLEMSNRSDPEYVEMHIQKNWDDRNNIESTRPDAIHVRLLCDNNVVEGLDDVVLNASNNWKFDIPENDAIEYGLKRYESNNDSHEYEYRWEEIKELNPILSDDPKTGYTSEINQTEEEVPASTSIAISKKINVTLTNRHEFVTTQKVRKQWLDYHDKYEKRPESIQVGLFKDNELVKTYKAKVTDPDDKEEYITDITNGKIELNEGNGWKAEAIDLPKYDDSNKLIDYEWKEMSGVGKYTQSRINSLFSTHNVKVHYIDRTDNDVTIATETVPVDTVDTIQDVINKTANNSAVWGNARNYKNQYLKSITLDQDFYKANSAPLPNYINHPMNQGWVWTFSNNPNSYSPDLAMDNNTIGNHTDLYLYYYGNASRTNNTKLNIILRDTSTGEDIEIVQNLSVKYTDSVKEALDKGMKTINGNVGWMNVTDGDPYCYIKYINVGGKKYAADVVPKADNQYLRNIHSYSDYQSNGINYHGWVWNFTGNQNDYINNNVSANLKDDVMIGNERTLYLFYYPADEE